MTRPAQQQDELQEQLDPAAERVRRKLVRFMGINLAILFFAVMAVVAAFVYKSVTPGDGQAAGETLTLPGDGVVEGTIDLPAGARILSQAVDGTNLSLHLSLAGGAEEIRVYDIRGARLIARFSIAAAR